MATKRKARKKCKFVVRRAHDGEPLIGGTRTTLAGAERLARSRGGFNENHVYRECGGRAQLKSYCLTGSKSCRRY